MFSSLGRQKSIFFNGFSSGDVVWDQNLYFFMVKIREKKLRKINIQIVFYTLILYLKRVS